MLFAFCRRFYAHRSQFIRTSTRRLPRRRRICLPLALEVLEDRTVPATFVVNTTADVLGHTNGQESLRQAILDSNSTPSANGPNLIVFDLSANDPNHFYYKNDGVNGQVSLAQKTNTTANSDSQISDIDPDWAHSWWTITPTSLLPAITAPVIIDGYSQSGASANTLVNGDNAVINVQIDGSLLPTNTNEWEVPSLSIYAYTGAPILTVSGGGSTITGLDLDGMQANAGVGIWLIDNGGNWVNGNFIGTDVSGTLAPYGLPNYSALSNASSYGVQISNGSQNNIIGTNGDGVNDPAERNVISANNYGVMLRGYSDGSNPQPPQFSSYNVVAGNYIGTDRSGVHALGNWTGVGTQGQAFDDRIGTNGTDVDAAGEGNTISGGTCGILLGAGYYAASEASHDYLIAGNSIGVNVNGQALANRDCGILTDIGFYDAQIGGSTPVLFNTIADNGGPGVWITDHRDNTYNIDVEGNSIYNNANLGINIGGLDFPTPDPVLLNNSEGHSGPNLYQNFPVLTAAAYAPSGTVIQGTLSANPTTSYTIRFYANAAEDPSGYGEGQTYLGSMTVQTDANGNATFSSPAFILPSGQYYLSATATDPNGNTSEFSKDIAPLAANAGGPYTLSAGNSLTLNASASVSPSGLPLSYSWTINGHTAVATGATPTLTWSQLQALGIAPGGSYTVSVQVTDSLGDAAESVSMTLTIASSQPVQHGQTATIGYWQNPNGQNLLTEYSTAITHWLATTYPSLYGALAGANDLLNQANANLAHYYDTLFQTTGQKLAAQVMSTALSEYFTSAALGAANLANDPFTVTAGGLGTAIYNVGSNGAAFGVANNTWQNVASLLNAMNNQAVNGKFFGSVTNANVLKTLEVEANNVFSGINQVGDLLS